MCPGVIDGHNCGTGLGALECGLGLVGNWKLTLYIFVVMGAPLILYCKWPTSWQCSQGYLVRSAGDYVIFHFGDSCCCSFSAKGLGGAAPFSRGTIGVVGPPYSYGGCILVLLIGDFSLESLLCICVLRVSTLSCPPYQIMGRHPGSHLVTS